MQSESLACVEFKFKSDRAFEQVTLDGGRAFLTAAELRQIVTERRLNGSVGAFGLKLINSQTGEEFVEDALINAGTSVLIRRVPLSLVSAPRSAELVASTNFASSLLLEKLPERRPVAPAMQGHTGMSRSVLHGHVTDPGEAEAQRIKMIMAAANAEWQRPTMAARGGKGSGGGMPTGRQPPPSTSAQRPPPPNYVCFRCNTPGHYIQFCPTNGDSKFDQVKRRTPVGIPRSQLKTVATTADEGIEGGLQMPDGSIARMTPDEARFDKHQAKHQAQLDAEQVPEELKCPVTNSLFRDAVLLPCCGASVSDDAVGQALLDGPCGTATCSQCGESGVHVDEVIPNRQLREVR